MDSRRRGLTFARESRYRSLLFSKAILDALPDAVVVVDAEGLIRAAHGACQAVFGYEPAELVGRAVEMLVPVGARAAHVRHRAVFGDQGSGRPIRVGEPLWGLHRDGHTVPLLISLSPVSEPIAGCVMAVARPLSLDGVLELQGRLTSAAVAAAANGIVITDASGVIVHVNEAFTRLTGYASVEVLGRSPRLLKSGAHDQTFYRAMWRTILAGEVWSGELVNRRRDGTTGVEEQTITPVRDVDGRIGHFIAIKQDVTARRRDEAALVRQLQELALLHDLALLSASGFAPEELAGRAAEIATAQLGFARLQVEPSRPSRAPVTVAPPSQGTARAGELTMLLRVGDQSFGTLKATFRAGKDAEDRDRLLLATVASQLALALKNAYLVEQLDEFAHTDALTGLDNRRRFMERAQIEIERAARHGRPLSLVMLDIDHFKDINDSLGHTHGDEVLRHFADVLRACCRLSDVVARHGGEEFVLLLAETGSEGALTCIERIRLELDLGREAGQPWCRFSAGVADHGVDHDDLETLLRVADEALYAAKAAGRNTTVVRCSRAAVAKDFTLLRRSSKPPNSPRGSSVPPSSQTG